MESKVAEESLTASASFSVSCMPCWRLSLPRVQPGSQPPLLPWPRMRDEHGANGGGAQAPWAPPWIRPCTAGSNGGFSGKGVDKNQFPSSRLRCCQNVQLTLGVYTECMYRANRCMSFLGVCGVEKSFLLQFVITYIPCCIYSFRYLTAYI